VRAFLNVFAELKVIVEGANVFFDDTARDVIARETAILQIKDSTANKGGVTSSSVAEVLPAFLLGDDYEKCLVDDLKTKARLVREVFEMIAANATAEARMLLALRRKTGAPLYKLSVQTSEWLLALQAKLYEHIDKLLARPGLVEAVFGAYVPPMLIERLGMKKALGIFSEPGLAAYRDAILTKKLASMALYRHAADWPQFLKRLEGGLLDVMAEVAAGR